MISVGRMLLVHKYIPKSQRRCKTNSFLCCSHCRAVSTTNKRIRVRALITEHLTTSTCSCTHARSLLRLHEFTCPPNVDSYPACRSRLSIHIITKWLSRRQVCRMHALRTQTLCKRHADASHRLNASNRVQYEHRKNKHPDKNPSKFIVILLKREQTLQSKYDGNILLHSGLTLFRIQVDAGLHLYHPRAGKPRHADSFRSRPHTSHHVAHPLRYFLPGKPSFS